MRLFGLIVVAASLIGIGSQAHAGEAYYCEASKAFYPTVQSCPTPWHILPTEGTAAFPPQPPGTTTPVQVSPGPPLCVLGVGAAKQFVELPPAECAARQASTIQKSSRTDNAIQAGYNQMSFDDFKIDQKKLARDKAKIILSGVYNKQGYMEYLFKNPSEMFEIQQHYRSVDSAVILQTEDAKRDLRKVFLNCQQTYGAGGCRITILARASSCTVQTAVGDVTEACLVVDDGW